MANWEHVNLVREAQKPFGNGGRNIRMPFSTSGKPSLEDSHYREWTCRGPTSGELICGFQESIKSGQEPGGPDEGWPVAMPHATTYHA